MKTGGHETSQCAKIATRHERTSRVVRRVAFKSPSFWDGYFQVNLKNKGWCFSTSLPRYSAVCTHQESEIQKKNFPKNTQLQEKKRDFKPSSLLFFQDVCLLSVRHQYCEPLEKETLGGHKLNSKQSKIKKNTNFLDPPNKFHLGCGPLPVTVVNEGL